MGSINLVQEVEDKASLQIKRRNKNTVKEVGDEALLQIESILNRKAQEITDVSKKGDYWHVQLEVLERKAIPDTQDILGIFELKLDSNLDVIEYKRVGMRHRGDMIVQEEF